MTDLILTTFDWVPEVPRGFVRDIRVRWAMEEGRIPKLKRVLYLARQHWGFQTSILALN